MGPESCSGPRHGRESGATDRRVTSAQQRESVRTRSRLRRAGSGRSGGGRRSPQGGHGAAGGSPHRKVKIPAVQSQSRNGVSPLLEDRDIPTRAHTICFYGHAYVGIQNPRNYSSCEIQGVEPRSAWERFDHFSLYSTVMDLSHFQKLFKRKKKKALKTMSLVQKLLKEGEFPGDRRESGCSQHCSGAQRRSPCSSSALCPCSLLPGNIAL